MSESTKNKFIIHYASHDNISEAAARSGISVATAKVYLNDEVILNAIQERRNAIAQVALWDSVSVLREWIDIATADPRELTAVHVYNCRYCWGISHAYQWTPREYAKACEDALSASTRVKPIPIPNCDGGMDYSAFREPHAYCPECRGNGVVEHVVSDTRTLSPRAAKLYAGSKMTRNGLEIQLRNQDAALEHIAKYLGMFVNKTELTGANGGPLNLRNVDEMSDEELALIAASGIKNADSSE